MRTPVSARILAALIVVIVGCTAAPESTPSSQPSPSPALTQSPGASAPASAPASGPPAQIGLPQPILTFIGHHPLDGRPRSEVYDLAIANWQDYPAELFTSPPELAPCVHIRDGSTTTELASLCPLSESSQLADLRFIVGRDQPVPTAVYVEVVDRQSNRTVRSLSVPIAGTAQPPLTPSPAATPSPIPSPTPVPTPLAEGWSGSELILSRAPGELSMVVGTNGAAHAAVVLGGGLFYLNNASGSWTRERLTTGIRTRREIVADGQPSLAIDDDGSIWIAFVHRSGFPDAFGPFPEAIYYVTNRTGAWSEPAVVVSGLVHSPSLQVSQGRIRLAYQQGLGVDVIYGDERFPIRYATDASGAWTNELVAGHGTRPLLRLSSDGTPRILFGDDYGLLQTTELRYATGATPTGSFTVEPVTGSSRDEAFYSLELDDGRRPNVVWIVGILADHPFVHVQRRDGAWSHEEVSLSDADLPAPAHPIAMTTDRQGSVHLLLNTTTQTVVGNDWQFQAHGVFYATDRSGELTVQRLLPLSANAAALTIDGQRRPHILLSHSADGEKELWYGIGPGY